MHSKCIPFFMNVLCTILQDIMQDTPVAMDGFTYEAEVLREWIESGHDTSPMTNLKLELCNLLPNYALRSAIQVRSANKNIEICKLFLTGLHIFFVLFLLIGKIGPRITPHLPPPPYPTCSNPRVHFVFHYFLCKKINRSYIFLLY